MEWKTERVSAWVEEITIIITVVVVVLASVYGLLPLCQALF